MTENLGALASVHCHNHLGARANFDFFDDDVFVTNCNLKPLMAMLENP